MTPAPAVARAPAAPVAAPRRPPRLLRWVGAWEHVAPPLAATAYLAALLATPRLADLLARLVPLLASAAGVAAFGYLLNDWGDVASDARAGRPNALAARPPAARAALLAFALGAGLAPWLLLPGNPAALGLLAVEVLALAAYSLPPFRFKSLGALGVAADALYGHLVPVAIVAALFFAGSDGAPSPRHAAVAVAALAVTLAAKGTRNILLHQIEDRDGDRRAGVATVVVRHGPLAVLAFVDRIVLPLELAALVVLLAALVADTAAAALAFALFAVVTAFEFSAWKLPHLPRRQLRFKFLWCLNDFHELWLPVALLAGAVARKPELWPLVAVHLVLFPRTPRRLARHLARAGRNLVSLVAGERG